MIGPKTIIAWYLSFFLMLPIILAIGISTAAKSDWVNVWSGVSILDLLVFLVSSGSLIVQLLRDEK